MKKVLIALAVAVAFLAPQVPANAGPAPRSTADCRVSADLTDPFVAGPAYAAGYWLDSGPFTPRAGWWTFVAADVTDSQGVTRTVATGLIGPQGELTHWATPIYLTQPGFYTAVFRTNPSTGSSKIISTCAYEVLPTP